jgi:hypothetical protein
VRRAAWCCLVVLIALALAGCAATRPESGIGVPVAGRGNVPTGPRAERPGYALGDRWIRNDGIWELIRIESDHYVFSAGTSEEVHLSKDLALVRLRNFGRSILEFTPTPRIDWPLAIGRRGGASGTFTPAHSDPFEADFRWEVDAYEDVAVPAGTFKAFRITATVVSREGTNFARPRWGLPPGRPAPLSYQLWYAPEIRQFVKGDSDTWWALRFALVAIDPGENEPLKVVVHDPKDQASLPPDADVVLRARASGGKGVARVTVSVNGEIVATEIPKGEIRKAVVVNLPLRLRDGKNVILLTATDPAGTSSQEARTLHYAAPRSLPFPPAGPPVRVGDEYVLLQVPMLGVKSVGAVSVALNDVVVDATYAAALKAEGVPVRLRLIEGENRIRIRYEVVDEGQRVLERTIVYDPAVGAPVQLAGESATSSEPRQATAGLPPAQESHQATADREREEKQRLEQERRREDEHRAADAERTRAEERRRAEEERRRLESQRLVALPPLTLSLSSPRDQARFEHQSVGLAGLVSGGKGVTGVTIALNGVEVRRQQEQAPQRAVTLSLPITLREGQNTLVVTATEIDGTVSQEVRTVFYDKPEPLAIAVRFPPDQLRVSEPASVAAAVVSSSKGVSRIGVHVNGVEVYQQSERTLQKSLLVTVPLKLMAGVNVVAFSAVDGEGSVRQEVRTVTLNSSPAVATTPLPVARHDRWAVVIGVGEYEHPSIPRLRYTVADAEAIYETLIGPAGFRKEHVLLLTDKSERKPTLKNIKWALGTFLARSARKDDTVLIFFAGHGAPETDPRGVERDGLAKYLIPSDAEADDLYSSALPMDELQTIFGRIEAERIVAFLDSCYSGAAGGRTFSSRRTRNVGIDEVFLERLTRSRGRAIITASRPAEVSIELPELGHGIFTYYLVNGLKGAADLNRDRIVSLQELYEYVEQQVTAKSRAVGGNQHPVMKGELEGVLPLTKVPAK